MSDNNSLNDSSVVEITGKIMVISIIVLFLVVVFVFFLHLYAKWFWYRREQEAIHGGASNNRRRGQLTPADILRRGLDASVLKSIPVVQFDPKDHKDGLECAVCLSELSEGEKARILPKCNHGFHADCIDMWFHSHSTCPICRNSIPATTTEVSLDSPADATAAEEEENSAENGDNSSPNFPTNVLFWGDETQVSSLAGSNMAEEGPSNSVSETTSTSSSSSSGAVNDNTRQDRALVIDIPRQIVDQEDRKPAMKGALVIDIPSHNEDQEDHRSPISSRIRSLKRLLSRDSRRFNPFSPTGTSIDVEQGVRSQT